MVKKNKHKVESTEHEHTWRHFESVVHEGTEARCHHYECTKAGCTSCLGIDLSGRKVKKHKWEEI